MSQKPQEEPPVEARTHCSELLCPKPSGTTCRLFGVTDQHAGLSITCKKQAYLGAYPSPSVF